jgi:hypothetical protein
VLGEEMSSADVRFLSWYEEALMVVDIRVEYLRFHERLERRGEIIQRSAGKEMVQSVKLWKEKQQRNETPLVLDVSQSNI